MTALNHSKEKKKKKKAEYNGKSYTKSYITHEMITNGGELKLYMGSKPSASFGVKKEDRPL